MKQDKSTQALNAYLNFWRLEEQRKRMERQKRGRRIFLSAASVAAVLVMAVTLSLHLIQQEDLYVVYLHGKKVTDKAFALKQMNEAMSDLPRLEQSAGEQLSNVFEVLETEE